MAYFLCQRWGVEFSEFKLYSIMDGELMGRQIALVSNVSASAWQTDVQPFAHSSQQSSHIHPEGHTQ